MEKPRLKFSKWYKWEDRNNFPGKDLPGVYMISVTNKKLEGEKVKFEDVVYVGMSNAKRGLTNRLYQLHKAIQGHRGGHSGGMSIYDEMGDYSTWRKKAYFCVISIECNVDKNNNRTPSDLIKMGWVAFLEYEALSKFLKIMGREPEYNKQ